MSTDGSTRVDGAPDTAAGRPALPGRLRRLDPVPLLVVAIVLAAMSVTLLVAWLRTSGEEAADAAVADVARQAIVALTNWEAADLEPVLGSLGAIATERFAAEAGDELEQLAGELAEVEARSEGELLDLVADASGGEGVALAVVRQEVTNTSLEAPRVDCWGVRAVARLVEGRWLVDDVELYGPNACPEVGG